MLAKLEIRNVENLMLARTSLHGGKQAVSFTAC